MIDIFSEQDLNLFMTLLDPHRFTTESNIKFIHFIIDVKLKVKNFKIY